ncbi:MAG: FkbM family methyltransferase [Deltaproteobacteria bacterium]
MNKFTEKENLELLLSEPITSVYQREQSTFDTLAVPFEKSIVLFGAGGLGKKTLAGLRSMRIEPLAFADNNPALWGKDIDGVKVLPLKDAAEKYGQSAVFVITIWKGEAVDTMAARQQQLKVLNCDKIIPFSYLYWKYGDIFLPHYAFDMPHKVFEQAEIAMKTFSLWADDASRHEYIAQLKWRIFSDFDGLPAPVKHEIYFPNDLFTISPDEVFVDCGAYDGDTIRNLLQTQRSFVGNIIAFEPDPLNFQKLEQYTLAAPPGIKEKLNIYPFAIGDKNSKVRFEAAGTEASFVGLGDFEVDCVTLDEILAVRKPTFIKMDIEGSELDALIGAQNTIKNNLPILAICSYHRHDHLWRIPSTINSYSDQYRFFLRPHLLEVWDLVCYAIPVNRLSVKE